LLKRGVWGSPGGTSGGGAPGNDECSGAVTWGVATCTKATGEGANAASEEQMEGREALQEGADDLRWRKKIGRWMVELAATEENGGEGASFIGAGARKARVDRSWRAVLQRHRTRHWCSGAGEPGGITGGPALLQYQFSNYSNNFQTNLNLIWSRNGLMCSKKLK
jgi:hypothetical protein